MSNYGVGNYKYPITSMTSQQITGCKDARLLQPLGGTVVRIGGMKSVKLRFESLRHEPMNVVRKKAETTYEIRALGNSAAASSNNLRPLIVYEPPGSTISCETPPTIVESEMEWMANVRTLKEEDKDENEGEDDEEEMEKEENEKEGAQSSVNSTLNGRSLAPAVVNPLVVFENSEMTSSSKSDHPPTIFPSEAAFSKRSVSNNVQRSASKPLDPEFRSRLSSGENQQSHNEGKADSGRIPNSTDERLTPTSIFCRECKIYVCDGQRHLYNTHVRLPLFRCPLCVYSAFVEEAIDEHLNWIHDGSDSHPISQIDDYSFEIEYWRCRCYAMRGTNEKHSKSSRKTKSKPKSKSKSKSKAYGRECQLCKEVTREVYIHVFAHLKVSNLFYCNFCKYKNGTRKQAIASHCRNYHNDPTAFSTRENEFIDEIKTLKLQCFGISTRQRTGGNSTLSNLKTGGRCAQKKTPISTTFAAVETPNNRRSPWVRKPQKKWKIECLRCRVMVVRAHKRRHIINRHVPPSFQCAACGKIFQTRYSAYEHLRRTHHFNPDETEKNLITKTMPDFDALTDECFGRFPVAFLESEESKKSVEIPVDLLNQLPGEEKSKKENSPEMRRTPPAGSHYGSPSKTTAGSAGSAGSQELSEEISPNDSNESLPDETTTDPHKPPQSTKLFTLVLNVDAPKRPVRRQKKMKGEEKRDEPLSPLVIPARVAAPVGVVDFKCLKCSKLVPAGERDSHMLDYHVPPCFSCSRCDAKFRQRANGLHHLRRRHNLDKEHLNGQPFDSGKLQVWIDKYFQSQERPMSDGNDVSSSEISPAGLLLCGKCDRSFKSKAALFHHRKHSHRSTFYEEHQMSID